MANVNRWIEHFKRMAEGKVGTIHVQGQTGGGRTVYKVENPVQEVTPIQQAVDQAKMQVKRFKFRKPAVSKKKRKPQVKKRRKTRGKKAP